MSFTVSSQTANVLYSRITDDAHAAKHLHQPAVLSHIILVQLLRPCNSAADDSLIYSHIALYQSDFSDTRHTAPNDIAPAPSQAPYMFDRGLSQRTQWIFSPHRRSVIPRIFCEMQPSVTVFHTAIHPISAAKYTYCSIILQQ